MTFQDQDDVDSLLQYVQAVWFLLSEGDYPFPSNYISYAVGNTEAKLPAWPMRAACDHVGGDFGVSIAGDRKKVAFNISIDELLVEVDWNATRSNARAWTGNLDGGNLAKLLTGLRDAVGVWYNVTGTLQCYDYKKQDAKAASKNVTAPIQSEALATGGGRVCTSNEIPGGNAAAWGVLVCNENLNLVNTLVQGIGNDFYWPPNVPKGWDPKDVVSQSMANCAPQYGELGLYGVPKVADPFATWPTVFYGGKVGAAQMSNVVFSNGALDPWSSAGVLQNYSDSVHSIMLDLGAHHLDLFFPDEADPECAKRARKFELERVLEWIA